MGKSLENISFRAHAVAQVHLEVSGLGGSLRPICVCAKASSVLFGNMGKFTPNNASAKKVKPVIAKDGDTILRVEPYMHFGKHTLRPFSVDGLPVFLPKGIEKEKKLYTCKSVRDLLDHMNSELCRRPAIGLSEKCASIYDFVEWSAENPDAPKAYTDLLALFSTSQGKAFIQACGYMNSATDPQRGTEESVKHVDAYLSFLKDNSDEVEKVLRKGMLVSSRMFLACASCFESLALADNVKAWAKKIAPVKQQHKAVRAWIEEPNNLRKAKKALVAILGDASRKTKKSKKSKLNSDTSASSDAGEHQEKKSKKESSDDASKASTSSDEKAPKKGKQVKKKSSDESSKASSSPDKKTKKKDNGSDSEERKVNKKTKKQRKSSSSSDHAKKKVKKDKKRKDSSSSDHGKKKAKKDKKNNDEVEEQRAPNVSPDAMALGAGVGRSLIKQGDAQVFTEAVATCRESIGKLAGGEYKKEDLQTLVTQLAPPILVLFPDAKQAWDTLVAADGDMIQNTAASDFVDTLSQVAAIMESWYVDHQGVSSASAAK